MKQWTEELFGEEARKALGRGVRRVSAPVAATMGARGRNVVFREYGRSKPTNDGVSIARRINPKDPFEKLGADSIKETAEATLKTAGDGTSGTVVVSQALVDAGEREISKGKDPMQLRTELEEARDVVLEALKPLIKEVSSRDDILNVARISVENEEMAQMVTDAVVRAGKHGAVTVEEAPGTIIEKEEVPGYFWEKGYISPYMITNIERNEVELENIPVIVTDWLMNLNKDLLPSVLNELVAAGETKALVIASRVEGELLASLIVNKQRGIFTTIAVSMPSTQEELEDIAAVVGATAVTKDKGIKMITREHVGRAQRIIVTANKTTIIAKESPALAERVSSLKDSVEKEEDEDKKTQLISRLAKLTDGIVILKVGANTDGERKYKKDKMDDAVCAAKAAVEEGIVPGAGAALMLASKALESKTATTGAKILQEAMLQPYKQILLNAQLPADGTFYNVKTGKKVKDLVEEGIVDSAKVVRCQIENSVSFAGTFLTIDSAIADFQEETTN